jgi:hypothetical protein
MMMKPERHYAEHYFRCYFLFGRSLIGLRRRHADTPHTTLRAIAPP